MSALDQATENPSLPSGELSAQPKRLLVVEDEGLIAELLADQIAELGYSVVGPACTMTEARRLATVASFDGALLDLNLNGELSHEIADILSRRNIPFRFITGYNELPAGLATDIVVLHKPFQLIDLGLAIEGVLMKRSVQSGGGTKEQPAN
jgi:DNA-binding response OmpR family regulator